MQPGTPCEQNTNANKKLIDPKINKIEHKNVHLESRFELIMIYQLIYLIPLMENIKM